MARAVALVFAMVLPSIATWLYFVAFAGHPAMRAVYSIGKIVQFSFPLVWLLAIERRGPRFFRGGTKGVGWGLASGALVGGLIVIAYLVFLRSSPFMADALVTVRAKVQQLGLGKPAAFVALALFYSLVHSFLEEYHWRGFVFGELRTLLRVPVAIALSSLAFMAHHVILLCVYFHGDWIPIAIFSAGIAAGGAYWSWLYQRRDSLLAPWLSHMMVDASLMAIGYHMIWGLRPAA